MLGMVSVSVGVCVCVDVLSVWRLFGFWAGVDVWCYIYYYIIHILLLYTYTIIYILYSSYSSVLYSSSSYSSVLSSSSVYIIILYLIFCLYSSLLYLLPYPPLLFILLDPYLIFYHSSSDLISSPSHSSHHSFYILLPHSSSLISYSILLQIHLSFILYLSVLTYTYLYSRLIPNNSTPHKLSEGCLEWCSFISWGSCLRFRVLVSCGCLTLGVIIYYYYILYYTYTIILYIIHILLLYIIHYIILYILYIILYYTLILSPIPFLSFSSSFPLFCSPLPISSSNIHSILVGTYIYLFIFNSSPPLLLPIPILPIFYSQHHTSTILFFSFPVILSFSSHLIHSISRLKRNNTSILCLG
jgi:hypothetical protein